MLLMLAHHILRWKTCNAENAVELCLFSLMMLLYEPIVQTQIITLKNNKIKIYLGPLRQGVIGPEEYLTTHLTQNNNQ